jgi:hypothetical protein
MTLMPGPLVSFDLREADRSSEADRRNPVAFLLQASMSSREITGELHASPASRNRSRPVGQRPRSGARSLELEHDRTGC